MRKRRLWVNIGLALYTTTTVLLLAGIFLSISLNPWFSFAKNALSDLGNPKNTDYYYVFNYTLILAGTLYAVYMLGFFRKYRPKTALLLLLASLSLILVGYFHEGYRGTHYIVSLLFFFNGITSTAVYWAERNSVYGLFGYLASIAVFGLQSLYSGAMGVAVPELVSGTLFYLIPLVEYVHRSRKR